MSFNFVDNSLILPEAIFKNPERAWCQFFVQDAKIDQVRNNVMTCEFGLGVASQWDQTNSSAIENLIDTLNQKQRIWFLADPSYAEFANEKEGENSVYHIFSRFLRKNPANHVGIDNPFRPLKPLGDKKSHLFDKDNIDSYHAIGITLYSNIPSEHFQNVVDEGVQHPPLLLLDEGSGEGPCLRVYGYKHLTRLLLNGAAPEQNPPYVLVETQYSPQLALFLKEKFPDSKKLVLKHVAASRGEGVVILNASDRETLDKELATHLHKESPFRSVSPLSICLIENFISTPEVRENSFKETLVRVSYLVTRNQNEIEVKVLSGLKCFAQDPVDSTSQYSGVVKLSKNDGTLFTVEDRELHRIQQIVNREIKSIAEKAVSYQPQEAVRFFLSSDNTVLNLLGVELFAPFLTCKYRERIKNIHGVYYRMSDTHCQLLIDLLKRNPAQIIRKRILENILLPDFMEVLDKYFAEPSRYLGDLLEAVCRSTTSPDLRKFIQIFLVTSYKNYFIFNPTAKTIPLAKKFLQILQEEYPQVLDLSSWNSIFDSNLFPRNYHETIKFKLSFIPEDLFETFLSKIYGGGDHFRFEAFSFFQENGNRRFSKK